MTLLIQQNDVGEAMREPAMLDRRRRRLSTVVKRHRIRNRHHIVSVHRKGAMLMPADETVRLPRDWKHIWIGPEDIVVITYLPLGGMGGGGGKGGGKNIGMMIGMLLLSIFVPMAVAAIPGMAVAGSLTMLGKIVAMGIIAG